MTDKNYKQNKSVAGSVLTGMAIGSVAGAVTMLLMAPQSGKETRGQLQKKGAELRDQAAEMIEETVTKLRTDSARVTRNSRQKAKELLHQGQDLVADQLDRVSEAALAGKKAIKSKEVELD
jgi:gas vesicle protein